MDSRDKPGGRYWTADLVGYLYTEVRKPTEVLEEIPNLGGAGLGCGEKQLSQGKPSVADEVASSRHLSRDTGI